ncbi:hypothetical protein POF51_25985 [Brevibacillus sp. AG]|uniref:hypothetical protein n=1 Tax=Brevibacillus sp. AG TaxID=3020891 RepID=UPI0023303EE1|nr:hypothetical protein [Brevibacillus sp. AG]MDC0764174.1 hypothetical protein [Brevibacillus sp. AG]
MNNSTSSVYFYTNEIAKQVNAANSTILRWAEELTKVGYEFERDEVGGKEQYRFNEEDLEVLLTFKKYRDLNFSLPTCAVKVIEERKTILSPIHKEPVVKDEGLSLSTENVIDDIVDQKLREKLEPFLAHLQKVDQRLFELKDFEDRVQNLPAPPTHDEIRRIAREEEKLRARITFDVNTKLREQAIKLWNEKPVAERTIKVFFKRIENESLKSEFIRQYMEQHFQEEFDKQYQEIEKESEGV